MGDRCLDMKFEFVLEDKIYKVNLEKKGEKYFVDFGNNKNELDYQVISPNCLSLEIDGKIQTVYLAEAKNKRYIFVQGEQFILQEKDATRAKEKKRNQD
jgi:hypothetical protein